MAGRKERATVAAHDKSGGAARQPQRTAQDSSSTYPGLHQHFTADRPLQPDPRLNPMRRDPNNGERGGDNKTLFAREEEEELLGYEMGLLGGQQPPWTEARARPGWRRRVDVM